MFHSWNDDVRWLKSSRVVVPELQTFSWGIIISCSQSKQESYGSEAEIVSSPQQLRLVLFPSIFTFSFILRTNQFTFLHYEKKNLPSPIEWKYAVITQDFYSNPMGQWPHHISWGWISRHNGQRCQVMGVRNSRAPLVTQTGAPGAQKADWALAVPRLSLGVSRICFYCRLPSTSLRCRCIRHVLCVEGCQRATAVTEEREGQKPVWF